MNTELIESKIDKQAAGAIEISGEFGGLRLSDMSSLFEISKLMAISQQAVPEHLRNNPGMCLAVCLTAIEWKMSPFAVANKTYVTNDRLNYESQLVHAVIEARAPIQKRLAVRYEGDGLDRVCIVSGIFHGETEAREHRSPPLKQLMPVKNDFGKVKGSPLWLKKPDVQMFYDTSRDWVRIYCPDVLLGIYTPDEVEQYGGQIGADAKDVTAQEPVSPGLHDRLKAAANHDAEGYRDGVVEAGLQEGEPATQQDAAQTAPEPTQEVLPPEKPRRRHRKAKADEPQGDAAAPQEPTSTSDPEPAPKAAEPLPPARPRNPAEYEAHVRAWLGVLTDPDEIERRFASERKMRNDAGVLQAERDQLRAVVDARIAELEAGG